MTPTYPVHGCLRYLGYRGCIGHRAVHAIRTVASAVAITAFVAAVAVTAPTTLGQSNTAAAGVYRLDPTSTYQHGCFPPCMCPMMETGSVKGVCRLVPIATGNVYQFYEIRDVRWVVEFPTAPTRTLRVLGSGTYQISLGPNTNTRTHQMTLDLAIDQNVTQHFDSG